MTMPNLGQTYENVMQFADDFDSPQHEPTVENESSQRSASDYKRMKKNGEEAEPEMKVESTASRSSEKAGTIMANLNLK